MYKEHLYWVMDEMDRDGRVNADSDGKKKLDSSLRWNDGGNESTESEEIYGVMDDNGRDGQGFKERKAHRYLGIGLGMIAGSVAVGYTSASHWEIIVYIMGGGLAIRGYYLLGEK